MIDTNAPQPDPAWDYYIIWQELHQIKDRINEALEFMNNIESSDIKTDEAIRSLLHPASNRLILIIWELSDDSDNNEPPDES